MGCGRGCGGGGGGGSSGGGVADKGGRENKAAADADLDGRVQELGGGLEEIGCGGIVWGGLDCEFDVGGLGVCGHFLGGEVMPGVRAETGKGEGGRGGDCETTCSGDLGFGWRVEIYPLAGKELESGAGM